MRILFVMIAAAGLLAFGCAKNKPAVNGSADPAPRGTADLISSDLSSHGRVSMVNPRARYAVLTFPPGSMPAANQPLAVYRAGSKVGQLRVTGPQRDNNTVADIITGEVRLNDEVRVE